MYFTTHTWGIGDEWHSMNRAGKHFRFCRFLIHPFLGIRGSGVETIR